MARGVGAVANRKWHTMLKNTRSTLVASAYILDVSRSLFRAIVLDNRVALFNMVSDCGRFVIGPGVSGGRRCQTRYALTSDTQPKVWSRRFGGYRCVRLALQCL